MEKKDIDLLVTVSRSKYFYEAAYTLNYTPSAISKQIAAIEKELGITLINRSSRGSTISLTPEGERLMPDIIALHDQFNRFEETLAAMHSEHNSRLRIGSRNRLSYLPRDELLADFIKTYPDTRIEFVADSYEELIHGLHAGELDGVFFTITQGSPNYKALCEVIRSPQIETHYLPPMTDMYLCIAEDSELAQLDEATLWDFRNYKITFSSDPHIVEFGGVMEPFLRLSRRYGFKLKPIFADTHNVATLNLARNGLVAVPTLTGLHPYSGLKPIRLKDWDAVNVSCFLTLRDNHSKPMTEFRHCLQNYASSEYMFG